MVGIVRFADFLEVVGLESIIVCECGHIIGLKKGLLLFPSATPKLSSIMQQLQHNLQQCNLRCLRLRYLNLSRTLNQLIEIYFSPSKKLQVIPKDLYPNHF